MREVVKLILKFVFDARPHLNPLPRGEDFSNHGLGDLIDCPANPGARIFKGTADDAPAPWVTKVPKYQASETLEAT